jgi:hypothetical protein
VDDKLKRIQELKKQKAQLSDEIAKLGEEVAAEMKAVLASGDRKPRKGKSSVQI